MGNGHRLIFGGRYFYTVFSKKRQLHAPHAGVICKDCNKQAIFSPYVLFLAEGIDDFSNTRYV